MLTRSIRPRISTMLYIIEGSPSKPCVTTCRVHCRYTVVLFLLLLVATKVFFFCAQLFLHASSIEFFFFLGSFNVKHFARKCRFEPAQYAAA